MFISATAFFNTHHPPAPLPEPRFAHPHLCFTNHDIDPNGWHVIKQPIWYPDHPFGPRLQSKIPKFLLHRYIPDVSWYAWHDYNQKVSLNPKLVVADLESEHLILGVFRHSKRDCAYDEARKVRGKRDHIVNIDRAISYLIENRHPTNAGLFELTSFYRKNVPSLNLLFEELVNLLFRITSRDQILFPLLMNTHQINNYKIFPGSAQAHSGGGNVYFEQFIPPLVATIPK